MRVLLTKYERGIMQEVDTINIYHEIKTTINNGRNEILNAMNKTIIETYWNVGRIIQEDIKRNSNSTYGDRLIKDLSIRLTEEFGKGYDESNLRRFVKFYIAFPKLGARPVLTWTHYKMLITVPTKKERDYYEKEAIENKWTTRVLERQIRTLSYKRRLAVNRSNKEEKPQTNNRFNVEPDPKKIIKDPYMLEFLNLDEGSGFKEKDLESGLITELSKFLLELGKGFCFMARQKCITYENNQYFIDLVFYNAILKCYVVIDLKTEKLTYEALAQIDLYRNYYDYEIRREDDNPTIGLLLVTEQDKLVAKYSSIYNNDKIFVSKYMTYMPTEKELEQIINKEKEIIEEYKKIKELEKQ